MPENVKCAECGFVARRETATRCLVEVERQTREAGTYGAARLDKHGNVSDSSPSLDSAPICFVHEYDLKAEYNSRPDKEAHATKLLNVLSQWRNCKQFVSWLQGYSPRKHHEMLLDRDRLAWQAAQATEAREFQSKQSEIARQHNRRSLTVAMIGTAVAVIGLLVNTLLGLLKEPPTIIVNPGPQPAAADQGR